VSDNDLPQTVGISVVPSNTVVTVGEVFTVAVAIEAGEQPVDSAQAYLDFVPTYLQVRSITGSGILPTELANAYDNGVGQIRYAAATSLTGDPISGTFTLVTIEFEAVAETPGTDVTFSLLSPRCTKVSYQGTNVLGWADFGTIVITGAVPTATSTPTVELTATPTSTGTIPTTTPTHTPVPAGVTLRFDPDPALVKPGDVFSVDVLIEAGEQAVDAAQVYISTNPAYLLITDLIGGTVLPTEILKAYDPLTGEIGYSAATFGAGITGTFTLVTIEFEAITETLSTPLTFDFIPPGRETKVRLGQLDVLGQALNGTVIILQTTPTPTASPTPSGRIDLPLVLRMYPTPTPTAEFTPTPEETSTPTPTSTATPAGPCTELIENGGFEETRDWIFGACVGQICPCPADYTVEEAFEGSRSVRLGLTPAMTDTWCTSSARQQVTIPADAVSARLTFWYWAHTEDEELTSNSPFRWDDFKPELLEKPASVDDWHSWAAHDWQMVRIYDQSLTQVLDTIISFNTNTSDWTFHSFDLELERYAGETIWIYFGVVNNGVGNKHTWMYVDDVSLEVCREATPTPTFTPSPTATSTPTLTNTPEPTLPMATNTPTPSVTPSPTPTPSGCPNIAENPSFEIGDPDNEADAEGWGQWGLIPAVRTDEEAHDGSWSMHVGVQRGDPNRHSYSSADQLLELPSGNVESVTLRFRYFAESDRLPDDDDAQYVLILNQWGGLQAEIMRLSYSECNGQTWVQSPEFDLLQYTWPLKVHFEVYNDGYGGTTRMYIDDVMVEVCASSATAPATYRREIEVAY